MKYFNFYYDIQTFLSKKCVKLVNKLVSKLLVSKLNPTK